MLLVDALWSKQLYKRHQDDQDDIAFDPFKTALKTALKTAPPFFGDEIGWN